MNQDEKKLALLVRAIEIAYKTELLLEELWIDEIGTGTPSRESLWTWGLANKYVEFKHYIVASIALPDLAEEVGMIDLPFEFEFKDWKYT